MNECTVVEVTVMTAGRHHTGTTHNGRTGRSRHAVLVELALRTSRSGCAKLHVSVISVSHSYMYVHFT